MAERSRVTYPPGVERAAGAESRSGAHRAGAPIPSHLEPRRDSAGRLQPFQFSRARADGGTGVRRRCDDLQRNDAWHLPWSREYQRHSPSSRPAMSRSSMHRTGVALLVAGVAVACVGSRVHPVASPQPVAQGVTTLDRMTVRTGEQQVQVDSPVVIARRVERIVQEAGGYLERSSASSNGNARVEGRVPAAELDGIMDEVAGLGKEKQRRITGTDVTDQYTDLEARLRSNIALRDRLQQLLGRAATLDDVLGLEKQIARLQADIDGLQARLDQLKSQTQLASLSVSLERKRVLGPLAVVGRGIGKLASKLFVIR